MDSTTKKRPSDSIDSEEPVEELDHKRLKMIESNSESILVQSRLNKDFVKFYKEQELFDETEWREFIISLHKDLPTSFRVTNHVNHLETTHPGYTSRDIIVKFLKEKFQNNNDLRCNINYNFSRLSILQTESTSESEINEITCIHEPTKPIEWYPFELAWHYALGKKSLRTSSTLKHLKHFLNVEAEIGNISRQEAVSMIPPLLLDVQKDHIVLDMCASPGSKSCQILEILNAYNSEGILVSNDIDITRCYLLTHQLQRIGTKNVIVTNHDGKSFPDMKIQRGDTVEKLYFDRILCDVPCSGDATIRKTPNAGTRWDYNYKKLHGLQLDILRRAGELLKVGGTMVYSTCSINPIENEAVVAQLLVDGAGAFELMDVSHKLPQLKRRPGVHTWKVFENYNKVYTSFSEVEPSTKLSESMFPQTTPLPLERCLRIYPHLQDTGGFFIAVIKKTKDFIFKRVESSTDEIADTIKVNRARTFSEDPFVRIPDHIREDILESVITSYGISPSCKAFEHLLIRTSKDMSEILQPSDINVIYSSSALCQSIVLNNKSSDVNIINAGYKILDNDAKKNRKIAISCDWRIGNDALPFVLPYITNRIVNITFNDFLLLIRRDPSNPPYFSDFYSETANQLKNMNGGLGGCLFVVKNNLQSRSLNILVDRDTNFAIDESFKHLDLTTLKDLLQNKFIAFLGWRGATSVSHNIDKLMLKSLRNLYLSENYNYNIDFTPKPVNEEVKRQNIEKSKIRKQAEQQKKLERKNERAEERRKRRQEARDKKALNASY